MRTLAPSSFVGTSSPARRAVWLLSAALGLSLAGCGDGAHPMEPSTAPAASASAAAALTVSIDGPTVLQPYEYGTWTAIPAGGTGPYSYTWYRDGAAVRTGATYGGSVEATGFQLRVTATDAAGASASSTVQVTAHYPPGDCGASGTPGQICPEM